MHSVTEIPEDLVQSDKGLQTTKVSVERTNQLNDQCFSEILLMMVANLASGNLFVLLVKDVCIS